MFLLPFSLFLKDYVNTKKKGAKQLKYTSVKRQSYLSRYSTVEMFYIILAGMLCSNTSQKHVQIRNIQKIQECFKLTGKSSYFIPPSPHLFLTKVMLEYYFKKVTDKSGQADRLSTDFSVQTLEPEITPCF